MAKGTNRRPVIPEPSPRFVLWSAVGAVIVLVIIVTLAYANGWVR